MPSHSLEILLVVCAVCWSIWHLVRARQPRVSLRSVAILVLGDIGRSPRMMYHAESFASIGFETYVIGYAGAKPFSSLLSIPHVRFFYLSQPPRYIASWPFIVAAPRKVLHQVLSILNTLLVRIPHPPEFIIVQNPPSIPTLALVWLVARLRGSKVIIDWHNLGYSILALKLGDNHIFVKIARWFESYFGRTAYAHLFVTRAMRDFLVREWGLQGIKVVLHDRPPARFHRASPSEMHELFLKLRSVLAIPALNSFLPPSSPPYSTAFTSMPRSSLLPSEPGHPSDDTGSSISLDPEPDMEEGVDRLAMGTTPMPALRSDRPALIVSSTSWTPDEDFGILLDSMILYEKRARELSQERRADAPRKGLPRLLVIVTGKGPLRDEYMQKIGNMQSGENGEEAWRFVRCVSLWLEAEDYPLLLGSADLGVSLHSSSSALDLPMKVVDMFGCGLPVCALGFACLDELVKDGVNGLVFHNAEQLAEQLESLLSSHPHSQPIEELRSSLQHAQPLSPRSPAREEDPEHWGTWAQNWDSVVRPLVLRDVAETAH
ncbi:glycosyltransferase family 33 protein [Fomitopsis serialis]|uniref:glycosyltransferase family 33 protein n=1 Tax=Fomitopsis serialis TaxID=139415 RepID=UPI002007669B|nr:glycosyltransferase family 33 protein [Neoantrodia serialis]KAH9931275.1 glycosyltransferase family 33 protein [Neoantrodia serialis]